MFIVIVGVSALFILMAFIGYKLSSSLSKMPRILYSRKEEDKYNIHPIYEESVE